MPMPERKPPPSSSGWKWRTTASSCAARRVLAGISRLILRAYHAVRRTGPDYELKVPYTDDDDLDKSMNDMLSEILSAADLRDCHLESDARQDGTDRSGSRRRRAISRFTVRLLPAPQAQDFFYDLDRAAGRPYCPAPPRQTSPPACRCARTPQALLPVSSSG